MRSHLLIVAAITSAGIGVMSSSSALQAQDAPAPAPAPASAPAANHLYDRLQLGVDLTNVRFGSTVRFDAANGGQGTEVNTGDLGLAKNSAAPRFGLRWRPGRRHEIEAGYQFARHSGDRALVDTIVFGDSTFAAGLRIKSSYQSDQAFLTYRFAFRARERSQIGLALGLGSIFFKIGIDAVAGVTSGGADTAIAKFTASRSVAVPTASLGLYGRWRAGSRWYLDADARALYFAVGRISADVLEGGVSGRYFVSPRIGFEGGFGITSVGLTIDPNASGGGVAGRLRYSLQTFRIGVVAVP